jgi:potassium-transporting ATPase potassium-binding subunit
VCAVPTTWKTYTVHVLATNAGMTVMIYMTLVFQDHLPLNPLHFAGVDPLLALNTPISFITSTDW